MERWAGGDDAMLRLKANWAVTFMLWIALAGLIVLSWSHFRMAGALEDLVDVVRSCQATGEAGA